MSDADTAARRRVSNSLNRTAGQVQTWGHARCLTCSRTQANRADSQARPVVTAAHSSRRLICSPAAVAACHATRALAIMYVVGIRMGLAMRRQGCNLPCKRKARGTTRRYAEKHTGKRVWSGRDIAALTPLLTPLFSVRYLRLHLMVNHGRGVDCPVLVQKLLDFSRDSVPACYH